MSLDETGLRAEIAALKEQLAARQAEVRVEPGKYEGTYTLIGVGRPVSHTPDKWRKIFDNATLVLAAIEGK
jgi:hypothetical protein